jgi:SAM-dependent methyltransferase
MRMSRKASLRVNDLLDRLVPPALGDSRLFAKAARSMYDTLPIPIDELKDRAFSLSEAEYGAFYRSLQTKFEQGDTDLTPESLDGVVAAIEGRTVLDVACGKGYLANILARDRHVVACDVALATGDRAIRHSGAILCEANVERLPFRDQSFDTVVSTHTLEHVQHLGAAIAELRRVAAKRVVVVVPRQRPYRVTFNPHIHFFPYRFSLLAWTGTEHPHRCELIGGDWLYVEDRAG